VTTGKRKRTAVKVPRRRAAECQIHILYHAYLTDLQSYCARGRGACSINMDTMRQSQSGTASKVGNANKSAYKIVDRARQSSLLVTLSTRSIVIVSIGIMVSAWFIARALVAFAPLTSVVAQYGTSKFPELLDATVEELTVGLERGDFTSVDLVQVCSKYLVEIWGGEETERTSMRKS
jgi:hypothetical protein